MIPMLFEVTNGNKVLEPRTLLQIKRERQRNALRATVCCIGQFALSFVVLYVGYGAEKLALPLFERLTDGLYNWLPYPFMAIGIILVLCVIHVTNDPHKRFAVALFYAKLTLGLVLIPLLLVAVGGIIYIARV